ncbi:hypothetical protein PHSC3_001470 [Chlamydiales bacterium STE3]|nr:hypothetical protein PHSC3_001470 [Chlamydiales bacterium STE3]
MTLNIKEFIQSKIDAEEIQRKRAKTTKNKAKHDYPRIQGYLSITTMSCQLFPLSVI